jgi:DNA transformation protein and related proteins
MNALLDHVLELMERFGPVTTKKMFGGISLYHNGLIFAIIHDDFLYLKGDESSKADFENEAVIKFTYEFKTGFSGSMNYWRAPERCLDDADEMKVWCNKAYEAALRSPKLKKKSKPS